jgi:hypothetical protein
VAYREDEHRLKDEERICGIWVVDLVSGQIVALLRFEDTLQARVGWARAD